MALFNCPECGAQISDKAAACPKCGVTINRTPTVINPPARRTPAISDRTAVGIIAAMAAVMYGLSQLPWLILLDVHRQPIYISQSYWGIAAIGLSFAAIGFAFTKQWFAAIAAAVTGMGAAVAACFGFKDSIIFDAPSTEMPDYKILYVFMVIFLLAATIATIVGATKIADRHIPDRRERKTESSLIHLAGITLCALLATTYYTVWSNITMYDNPTPHTGNYYILSGMTTTCIWIAIFGVCAKRWIATAITAAINMLYGIYTLTTDGLSGTYYGLGRDYEIESTTFAGGIYAMILVAGLLLALSIIADRRQNAQAAAE